MSNLSRLDESEDADSQGVYKILDVFENLFSFIPPLAEQVVAETGLMKWLVGRIQVKEFDTNTQYASQILAILLQSGREGVMKLADMEGLDVLLKVISVSCAICDALSSLENLIQRMNEISDGSLTRTLVAIPQGRPEDRRRSRIHGRHLQLPLYNAR